MIVISRCIEDNCQFWTSRSRKYLALLVAFCKIALFAAISLRRADLRDNMPSNEETSIRRPAGANIASDARPTKQYSKTCRLLFLSFAAASFSFAAAAQSQEAMQQNCTEQFAGHKMRMEHPEPTSCLKSNTGDTIAKAGPRRQAHTTRHSSAFNQIARPLGQRPSGTVQVRAPMAQDCTACE